MIPMLKQRFIAELPLWRLSGVQFLLLLLWAAWPSLATLVFPGNEALALAPVFIFLPFVYVVGYPLTVSMAGLFSIPINAAHSLAIGITVFVLAYLGLVSWRQGRRRRSKAGEVLAAIVLVLLVAFLIYLVFWLT